MKSLIAENWRPMLPALLGSLLGLVLTGPLPARTIVLTDEDCDKMASISPEVPLSGWAGIEVVTATFSSSTLEFYHKRAFLIRYPIDRIPKGQKIAKAELSFASQYQGGNEQRLHLHRLLGEWGTGVCWEYRAQRPKKLPWSQPGARGSATDRAARPSAVVRSPGNGEKVVNVTEDVELWYTGASANQGWVISMEDPEGFIRLNSPVWPPGRGSWKLRITYDPE